MTTWNYNQQVKIVAGIHAGKHGLLKHWQGVGIELDIAGQRVICNLDELEKPGPDEIGILLALPENKHQAFHERLRQIKEGDS